jgi:DNA invertase Pin-like site-specific DNA recombinase
MIQTLEGNYRWKNSECYLEATTATTAPKKCIGKKKGKTKGKRKGGKKAKRMRERKSRAKFIPNPKAYKRRVIKLVEKIKHWKIHKYQKIVNEFWKGVSTEDSIFGEDDSVQSLETIEF